jgi:hypothetical protein
MKRLLFSVLFALVPLAFAACGEEGESHSENGEGDVAFADEGAYAELAPGAAASGALGKQVAALDPEGRVQQVAILDQGLQMTQGTYTIPVGWQIVQDVATDPNTGQPARHQLDIRGPNGELIRGLRPTTYGPMTGSGFEQTWRGLALQGAQGEVRDVSIGTLQRSERLERLRPFRRAAAKAQQMGFRVEGLEAPLRAQSDRGPVEGAVHVLHWTSPQMSGMGVVLASVILSPADRVTETLRLNARLANGFQPNPAFEQRMEQINQAVMQRQAAQHQQRMANRQAAFNAHQQRMANRQAAFDAHQQNMQTLSGIQDQQFQTWQGTQRSSDEMQRRTVNGIHGTADVYNNQTGETTYGVDGTYDTYWTDPSGTVVGTEGYDNPDPLRYEQGTDLDDLYDEGGYDGW